MQMRHKNPELKEDGIGTMNIFKFKIIRQIFNLFY
jgi:hypothetical protein